MNKQKQTTAHRKPWGLCHNGLTVLCPTVLQSQSRHGTDRPGKAAGEGGWKLFFSPCPTYADDLPIQCPHKSHSLSVPLVQASFLRVCEGILGVSVRKSIPPHLAACILLFSSPGRGAEPARGQRPLARQRLLSLLPSEWGFLTDHTAERLLPEGFQALFLDSLLKMAHF